MAGDRFDCTRCGMRPKARDVSGSGRCPFCGAKIRSPRAATGQAPEESASRRRPRRRGRRGPAWSWADHGWLIAAGGGFLLFLAIFLGSLIVFGSGGIADRFGKADSPSHMRMELIFCNVAGLALYVGGVLGVKNRRLAGRIVVTGPLAVALGIIFIVSGALVGGFSLYALLNFLAHGR